MNFLGVVFLYLVKRMNGSRTIFGAYHILKGKKSAQTLQDCQLFYVAQLFGVYKDLNRKTFLEMVDMLVEKNYISFSNENYVSITTAGDVTLTSQLDALPFPAHLNGFAYKDITTVFWKRLALLTQSISFLKKQENNFVPIIKDDRTQQWVKKKLTNKFTSIDDLSRNLHKEFKTILQQFTERQSLLFVLRLTGRHRFGLTLDQIADYFKIDTNYARIEFLGVIHGILEKVIKNNQLYPTLFSLIEDKANITLLTETAQKTLALLKKSLEIEQIIKIRKLKRNTVEDHLVEIAMNVPDFPIDHLVTKKKQAMIYAAIQQLQTRKLKIIKEGLSESISYFEIRLTIAKRGFENEFR